MFLKNLKNKIRTITYPEGSKAYYAASAVIINNYLEENNSNCTVSLKEMCNLNGGMNPRAKVMEFVKQKLENRSFSAVELAETKKFEEVINHFFKICDNYDPDANTGWTNVEYVCQVTGNVLLPQQCFRRNYDDETILKNVDKLLDSYLGISLVLSPEELTEYCLKNQWIVELKNKVERLENENQEFRFSRKIRLGH